MNKEYFRCPVCELYVLEEFRENHLNRHKEPRTARRYLDRGLPVPGSVDELEEEEETTEVVQ
ncbi:MAG: hypothetical protein HY645_09100 [Acidobacteria bacterium]|nr:hypothetical protein [Acidobacteriota bacterium]